MFSGYNLSQHHIKNTWFSCLKDSWKASTSLLQTLQMFKCCLEYWSHIVQLPSCHTTTISLSSWHECQLCDMTHIVKMLNIKHIHSLQKCRIPTFYSFDWAANYQKWVWKMYPLNKLEEWTPWFLKCMRYERRIVGWHKPRQSFLEVNWEGNEGEDLWTIRCEHLDLLFPHLELLLTPRGTEPEITQSVYPAQPSTRPVFSCRVVVFGR